MSSWNNFKIKVPDESKMLCQAAMRNVANSGVTTLFWEDRWLEGRRIQEIAPLLYRLVSTRIRASCLVGPAVENGSWALDVGPDIGPDLF